MEFQRIKGKYCEKGGEKMRTSYKHERLVSNLSVFISCVSVCLLMILFTSCTQTSSGPIITPTSTTMFANDGSGNIQFETNDTSKYSTSFWEYYPSTQNTVSTITATIYKNSGDATQGFGIIFAHQDNNDFYRVLIAENGQYSVYKIVSGTWAAIQGWVVSTKVNTGYGIANTIEVTYSSGNYNVYINNLTTPVYTFAPDSTLGTAGTSGFFAAVGSSSTESFPNTPVDVRFRMTSPVSIP
jgi:hypothetical protein